MSHHHLHINKKMESSQNQRSHPCTPVWDSSTSLYPKHPPLLLSFTSRCLSHDFPEHSSRTASLVPPSRIPVPSVNPSSFFWVQLSGRFQPSFLRGKGRAVNDDPTQETAVGFLSPGFSLPGPRYCKHLGNELVNEKSVCLCLANKMKIYS